MRNSILLFFAAMLLAACGNQVKKQAVLQPAPFLWENANVYFLLTDRFNNADTSNDVNFGRDKQTGPFRGFEGGDFKGITQKINEGYFADLGINVLWFSPIFEQGHGITDEGTGPTYGYHGYWAKDFSAIDPNWGTEEEFAELVETAHQNGIRILMDVVINHIGPDTKEDPNWGPDWVRMQPACKHDSYESTVHCALVENLPDVKTENKTEDVELPSQLVQKFDNEGRLEKEMQELDEYFAQTGYARAPRYYIIKWLTDFVRKYGIDGYRIDTAKHTEADVWSDLWDVAHKAFADWKAANPEKVLDDTEFFMVGEVYNYGVSSGRTFMNGEKPVDYFAHDMLSLINFEFKWDAMNMDYEALFSKYSNVLHGDLAGLSVMNYITSHDDHVPFDKSRERAMEGGTKLLLSPGSSQVYYGDESNRHLDYPEAVGDATLRSFMNWDELASNKEVNGVKAQDLWQHYSKLGKFRIANPAVGMGVHKMINENPYVFSREMTKGDYSNKVVVALDAPEGQKEIPVGDIFADGTMLTDYYSGQSAKVVDGKVAINSAFTYVLLAR